MDSVEISGVGRVSRLVFGCGSMGGRVSERSSRRALSAAFEAGVTSFDVARSYGYGDAERILGDFVRGRRDRVQIVTKAGIVAGRNRPALRLAKSLARAAFELAPGLRRAAQATLARQHQPVSFSRASLEQSLTQSLRALGTDHVDCLLLHACSVEVATRPEIHDTLRDFVSRGLARRVGVAAGAREARAWVDAGGEPTAELAAVEIPALGAVPSEGSCWLANQPLGGGQLLAELEARCHSLGLPRELALQWLLQRPLRQGAHAVVLSMLSADHVSRAIAALAAPELGAEILAQLETKREQT